MRCNRTPLLIYLYSFPLFTATGSNPRRPKAREHNVGRAGAAALPGEGHRLRQRQPRQQGGLQYLPAEQILQVTSDRPKVRFRYWQVSVT